MNGREARKGLAAMDRLGLGRRHARGSQATRWSLSCRNFTLDESGMTCNRGYISNQRTELAAPFPAINESLLYGVPRPRLLFTEFITGHVVDLDERRA